MRIKPIALIKGFIAVIFMYSLFCSQTFFGTSDYTKFGKLFPAVIILCGVAIIIKKRYYITFDHDYLYKSMLLVGPYIGLFIFTIMMVIINPGLKMGVAFPAVFNPLLYVLSAVIAFCLFGESLIDIIWIVCLANYTVYVIAFIRIYGPTGLLHYIALTDSAQVGQRPLEVHEVTFILGFVFVYYLMKYGFEKKWHLITSGIYVLLGYKRILLLGMLIAIVLYYLVKNRKKAPLYAKIIAIITLCICIVWVIFTSSDLYLLLSMLMNVELSGRDKLMARVRDLYSLSFLYLGHGVGFTTNFLIEWRRLNSSSTVTALHNDVLKYYIDLGCIPALVFFINMIVWNTKRYCKVLAQAGVRYAIMIAFLMICWLTDNLASYPNFLFVFNAIILSLVCEKKDRMEINE